MRRKLVRGSDGEYRVPASPKKQTEKTKADKVVKPALEGK